MERPRMFASCLNTNLTLSTASNIFYSSFWTRCKDSGFASRSVSAARAARILSLDASSFRGRTVLWYVQACSPTRAHAQRSTHWRNSCDTSWYLGGRFGFSCHWTHNLKECKLSRRKMIRFCILIPLPFCLPAS